jgi:hypothetical protein
MSPRDLGDTTPLGSFCREAAAWPTEIAGLRYCCVTDGTQSQEPGRQPVNGTLILNTSLETRYRESSKRYRIRADPRCQTNQSDTARPPLHKTIAVYASFAVDEPPYEVSDRQP